MFWSIIVKNKIYQTLTKRICHIDLGYRKVWRNFGVHMNI